MAKPKNVLYFAENALSAIQGGGIVAYAVLKGLPADRLLGFFDYRNITPVTEYADRFTYLGGWRTPWLLHRINLLTKGRTEEVFHRLLTEPYIRLDFEFVRKKIEREGFVPEIVYFSGLSYRYLRLAVMVAEHYNLPMVQLNMDDWMQVEADQAGPRWGGLWYRRIVEQLTRASARSLVSTSNSPRLASILSRVTGYRHVAANNCCSDLMRFATDTPIPPNPVPVIVYAGALNEHLQGETLKILATAVAELNAEGTRVHLHIYTPWEFAPAANSIQVPNAVFYKGQVGREQLADIFRAADFLVTTVTHRQGHVTLFRHSLSTKLSEYLCVGKPVISMGHSDWHLHEYVQDNGCGFSILMDENYSRATIKKQLRRILATDPAMLARIGRKNRELWTRAHDTTVMARDTRRAVGLEPTRSVSHFSLDGPRGVVWVGGEGNSASDGWVPLAKLKSICRRLVDVFEHRTVDLIGVNVQAHPQIDALAAYCSDIGLRPAIVNARGIENETGRWEPVGARWSLDAAQRRADGPAVTPKSLFEQVAKLRGSVPEDTPAQRAINQLSVRVSEAGAHRPAVWFYGSIAVGHEVIRAIKGHAWLGGAVHVGGFIASPGYCKGDLLQGHPWKGIDTIQPDAVDFIVVTSETSRLAIQEELSRAGLLDRLVPLYGMAGTAPACGYERVPDGPGQSFIKGSTAHDYAARELIARTMPSTAAASGSEDVRKVA